MNTTVIINDLSIEVEQYKHDIVEKEEQRLHRLDLEFKVTNEQYHDVTVELYNNDFRVRVPEQGLEFSAVIQKYSTSITNLYEEQAIGDFKLTLIEKE